MSGQIDPYGRIHGKVVGKEIHHIDVNLLKPLKFNSNIKLVDLALLLISLFLCGIIVVNREGGVGSSS